MEGWADETAEQEQPLSPARLSRPEERPSGSDEATVPNGAPLRVRVRRFDDRRGREASPWDENVLVHVGRTSEEGKADESWGVARRRARRPQSAPYSRRRAAQSVGRPPPSAQQAPSLRSFGAVAPRPSTAAVARVSRFSFEPGEEVERRAAAGRAAPRPRSAVPARRKKKLGSGDEAFASSRRKPGAQQQRGARRPYSASRAKGLASTAGPEAAQRVRSFFEPLEFAVPERRRDAGFRQRPLRTGARRHTDAEIPQQQQQHRRRLPTRSPPLKSGDTRRRSLQQRSRASPALEPPWSAQSRRRVPTQEREALHGSHHPSVLLRQGLPPRHSSPAQSAPPPRPVGIQGLMSAARSRQQQQQQQQRTRGAARYGEGAHDLEQERGSARERDIARAIAAIQRQSQEIKELNLEMDQTRADIERAWICSMMESGRELARVLDQ